MNIMDMPTAMEPVEWFVVFHTSSPRRWLSWLAIGKFKHVSVFAYYPGFRAWLVYDIELHATRLVLVQHDDKGKELIAQLTEGATLVKIARRQARWSLFTRFGFYCVPAVKHLIGLDCCALRPDALYRQLLRNGGVCIDGRRRQHSITSTTTSSENPS